MSLDLNSQAAPERDYLANSAAQEMDFYTTSAAPPSALEAGYGRAYGSLETTSAAPPPEGEASSARPDASDSGKYATIGDYARMYGGTRDERMQIGVMQKDGSTHLFQPDGTVKVMQKDGSVQVVS